MQNLLNPNIPFDVSHLDRIVNYSNNGSIEEKLQAQQFLVVFMNDPNSFSRVQTILSLSTSINTHHYALQILYSTIKNRWNQLSVEIRLNLKDFVSKLISHYSSNPNTQKMILNKVNQILIELVKQLWPDNWVTFIDEIITFAQSNEYACMNSLQIFRLLAEDLSFENKELKHQRLQVLQQTLSSHIQQIFQFGMMILSTTKNENLLCFTLETLQAYFPFLDSKIINETQLPQIILSQFKLTKKPSKLGVVLLTTFSEFTALPPPPSPLVLLLEFLSSLFSTIPSPIQFAVSGENKMFLRLITTNITQMIKNIEFSSTLIQPIEYLLKLGEVDDSEIFFEVMETIQQVLQNMENDYSFPDKQRITYPTQILIFSRMPRLKEMLLVEENGEVIRRPLESVSSTLYAILQQCLLSLVKIDNTMINTLMNAFSTTKSERALLPLCYSAASLSGVLLNSAEISFFSGVVGALLTRVSNSNDKNTRILITGGLLVVVGSYKRLLCNNSAFLKVVTSKVVEFMSDDNKTVQEMCVTTLKGLSENCGSVYARTDALECLNTTAKIMSVVNLLQRDERDIFYESLGCIAAFLSSEQLQQFLVMCLSSQNKIVLDALQLVQQKTVFDQSSLKNALSDLYFFATTSQGVISSYLEQLSPSLLSLYTSLINQIFTSIQTKSPTSTLSVISTSILKIFNAYIRSSSTTNLYNILRGINTTVIPLFGQTPINYRPSIIPALYTTSINKLKEPIFPTPTLMYSQLINPCLEVINKDNTSYPDMRRSFFGLIESICSNCTTFIEKFSERELDELLTIICWGINHIDREVYLFAFGSLNHLFISAFAMGSVPLEALIKPRLEKIIQTLLTAITDLCHTQDFEMIVEVIRRTFLVDAGLNKCQQTFIQFFVNEYGLNSIQIEHELMNVLQQQNNQQTFKIVFMDFLVSTKEFNAHDLEKTG
ncbi:Chromosome region maintenance protein [Entamoeba marina]